LLTPVTAATALPDRRRVATPLCRQGSSTTRPWHSNAPQRCASPRPSSQTALAAVLRLRRRSSGRSLPTRAGWTCGFGSARGAFRPCQKTVARTSVRCKDLPSITTPRRSAFCPASVPSDSCRGHGHAQHCPYLTERPGRFKDKYREVAHGQGVQWSPRRLGFGPPDQFVRQLRERFT
jgi:hypothetical protein